MVSFLGDFVRSINPSLVSSPPPGTEQTGSDVCYLGPNGEEDKDYLVYCKDLPNGQRAMIGSWYIDPERHAIEYIAFVAVSLILISLILPRLARYPKELASNLKPPTPIKVTTLLIYTCQLYYKCNGYPGKILFMGMPCNVLWTMWAILCFWPKLSAQTMHVMYQLIVPYTSLAIVAVATPDTSDLVMWMEVTFFFCMHYALIVYPIYLIKIRHISILPLAHAKDGIVSNFLKIWILACAYFALFYFGVGVPLSLLSGLNLNYMLHPPPNPGDMVSGPNFRLQSTLACAAVFFLTQLLMTVFECFGRGNTRSYYSKHKST